MPEASYSELLTVPLAESQGRLGELALQEHFFELVIVPEPFKGRARLCSCKGTG